MVIDDKISQDYGYTTMRNIEETRRKSRVSLPCRFETQRKAVSVYKANAQTKERRKNVNADNE